MLSKSIRFFKKDFLIQKSYKLSFILSFFSIFTSVTTFYFIARVFDKGSNPYLDSYGGQYFPFVLIGIAFSDFLFMGLKTFSSAIRNEQLTGTLGAILITPTKLSNILVGTSIWDFGFASFRVFVYLLLGVGIFGVSINLSGLAAALVILLLTVVSFSGLGIIAGSFIMVFKKGDPVTWAFSGISALLGGVYYPVAVLPDYLQKLSRLLPITYSLRAMRMALLGKLPFERLMENALMLVLFSVIILPLSIMCFNYSVKKAKIDGTLLQY